MILSRIILNLDEDLKPAIITWNEGKQDYVIDVPDGISRTNLIAFVDEVKRITEWEDA